MIALCAQWNYQVVQWLHNTDLCRASLAVLDDVACQGQLNAVIWLSERGAAASEAAVNCAADSGHVDVVEYLLRNRQEVDPLKHMYYIRNFLCTPFPPKIVSAFQTEKMWQIVGRANKSFLKNLDINPGLS